MSDSVAWCILAGFKITSVFSRIIYHTIESVCEFAANILQGYIYEGKKNVTFNVTKKIKQKNKSVKLREDGSRIEKDPKIKHSYRKTNESLMSEDMSKNSTNINQDMLTVSGQRFSFQGTDKIIECNLQGASKITVSFDFYPSTNQSMVEIKNSSRLNAFSQKKMVETDKPKMPTNTKQSDGQLDQNEIPRDASRLKYKYESKSSDEVLNNNTLAAKNCLETALSARDVSINVQGTSYEKVQDPLSNENLETPVIHISQDTENLLNKVSRGENSLDVGDKQRPNNLTVDKGKKSEISVNLSCAKKQGVRISAEESRRPALKQGQINLENSPEHSIITQTTSPIKDKEVKQTISENQQSYIEKGTLIPPEQYPTLSTSESSYLPAPDIDKLAFDSMSQKSKKALQESTTDRNKHEQQSHDKSRMSDSLANEGKKSVSSPKAVKKPLLGCPASNDKKLEPESDADKSVMLPASYQKTLSKSPDGNAKKPTQTVADKKPTQSLNANKYKPLPASANKLSPASHNKKTSVPLPAVNKRLSESPSSNDKKSLPQSDAKKTVTSPKADEKPLSKSSSNDKKPTPILVVDKKTTPTSVTDKKPASNDKKPKPESDVDKKTGTSPEADKKPLSKPSASNDEKPTPTHEADKKSASNDKKPKPESDVDKKTGTSPEADKKPLSKPSPSNDEKPTPTHEADKKPTQSLKDNVPEINKLTPDSPNSNEKSSVSSSAAFKNPVPSAVNDKRSSESSARNDKKPGQSEDSLDEKPAPTPEADEKPAPTPEAHNEVSEELINTTKAASAQSINFNTVESDCKAVGEINEGDNANASSNKELESQTQSIDIDSSHEDFSENIDEMLEKGPSIVIAPDDLLNPLMPMYGTGTCRLDVSNIEMNSKYIQDGWDESDKCFYEYVIQREQEMGQYDPTAFKKESSIEMDKCDKNNSKGENVQRDSSVLFGEVIDKYNPMTEVPKYYDLIKIVDSKYILEKSRIKCYKKREEIDNFKGVEDTNKIDDPKVSSKDTQHRTEKQSPRETRNADHGEQATAFDESSGAMQESLQNVKTAKELGARPKTYPLGKRK